MRWRQTAINGPPYRDAPPSTHPNLAMQSGSRFGILDIYRVSVSSIQNWFPVLDDISEANKRSADAIAVDLQILALAIAVCAQTIVKANSKVETSMEFALAWDMPIVQFGARKRNYRR
uniref:Uncharacterized protein n=1 Tax=Parascaris equorum TaxID=6256 RepID=A0A914RJT9_PAREQ